MCGSAGDGGGGIHVVAADVALAERGHDFGESGEGHHVAVGVADAEAEDVLGVGACMTPGAELNLIDAAEFNEVVDVGAAHVGRQRCVDVADGEVGHLDFVAVDFDGVLRNLALVERGDGGKARVAGALFAEGVDNFHHLGCALIVDVENLHLLTRAHAEAGDGGRVDGEDYGLLNVGGFLRELGHDVVDGASFAVFPGHEGDEHRAEVRAAASADKAVAGDSDDVLDAGDGHGIACHAVHDGVSALERGAGGELDGGHEVAHVLGGEVAGRHL